MGKDGSFELLKSGYAHLAQAFAKIFISVVELDLRTGNAITLKSPDSEVVLKTMPWSALLERYAQRRASAQDRHVITEEFSFEQLSNLIKSGQTSKSIEVRCGAYSDGFEWMELSAMLISEDAQTLLITTRNINEQRILKSIVEQFIYKNCDYFLLLDTRNNSFTRFMGSTNGTNLPPAVCNDYTAMLKKYNHQYVMPYDVDRVTAEMQIEHILQVLESQNDYDFYCDGIPEKGTPRRKRMQFAYQDKQNGLVLVTRTDVTEVYKKERAVNEQLMSAMVKSQTDSLTLLYNHATTASLISQKLAQSTSEGAFLFIDVDNFKSINDSMGHLKGDYFLKFVAQALRELIGDCGIIGRIGGDEFLIFLQEKQAVKNVELYAKQICKAFSNSHDYSISHLNISCSIGISMYPKDGTDYQTLVQKADQALYHSKKNGKNNYCFYSSKTKVESYESMITKID
ncbi:MAG: GGDEF domain-containing protein [Christensenellaceae bacterium]